MKLALALTRARQLRVSVEEASPFSAILFDGLPPPQTAKYPHSFRQASTPATDVGP